MATGIDLGLWYSALGRVITFPGWSQVATDFSHPEDGRVNVQVGASSGQHFHDLFGGKRGEAFLVQRNQFEPRLEGAFCCLEALWNRGRPASRSSMHPAKPQCWKTLRRTALPVPL